MKEFWYGIIAVSIGIVVQTAADIIKQHYSYKLQNKSRVNAMEVLSDVLSHKTFTDRSFSTLSKRLVGFTDNEVRLMLHEIGAKPTFSEEKNQREWWYLASRQEERNKKLADKEELKSVKDDK